MKLFHDQIESAVAFDDGKTSKQGWESQTLSSEPVAEQGFKKKTTCYYEKSIATSRGRRRWIQSRTIHVFVLFSLRFHADNRPLDQESSDREMLLDFSLAQSTPSARLDKPPGGAVGVAPPSISPHVRRVQGHASLFVARNKWLMWPFYQFEPIWPFADLGYHRGFSLNCFFALLLCL